MVNRNFDNVVNILINRPHFDNDLTSNEKKHITERALVNYDNYDLIIENDGSLIDLKEKIQKVLKEEVL